MSKLFGTTVSSSRGTMRATMMVVLLILSTTNVVRGQNPCNDDQDCPSEQYCYNVSHICVNFTRCKHYHREEGSEPARQPSLCGPCLEGYKEEIFGTGEANPGCRLINVLQRSSGGSEPSDNDDWTECWIAIKIVVPIGILILIAFVAYKITKCTGVPNVSASGRFFEKVSFLTARPTAPPQDDAAYHLRGPCNRDEELPPVYASVIGPSIAKNHLVNATPTVGPWWVGKPTYDADYNDNVADGVAIPIHSSSTNLQMETDDEGETNPSSWTPDQVTVDVPTRPFALFSNNEQDDNVLNNVLSRGNCSSDSREESTSDDGAETPEEASGPRIRGGIYCGPNVQINQTITLNIAKNSTK